MEWLLEGRQAGRQGLADRRVLGRDLSQPYLRMLKIEPKTLCMQEGDAVLGDAGN